MEYSSSEISPKWLSDPIYQPSAQDFLKAQEKQEKLTKPKGSLGLLESIAIHISALQKTLMPEVETAQIIIFAADHGIAQENVSAFPQVVTAEMVKNFSTGGAAIAVAVVFLRVMMMERIGGMTGDTVGATVEIAEAIALIGLLF